MGPAVGDADDQPVRWFRALGDRTRLRIIDCLRQGEASVGHLGGILTIGQSRLSFHLKTLRDAGLVRDRRQGRLTYYALDPSAFQAVARLLESIQERRSDPAGCRGDDGPTTAPS
jgi:ArsR family transcriptional regulator